jgi:hypothetical protein
MENDIIRMDWSIYTGFDSIIQLIHAGIKVTVLSYHQVRNFNQMRNSKNQKNCTQIHFLLRFLRQEQKTQNRNKPNRFNVCRYDNDYLGEVASGCLH